MKVHLITAVLALIVIFTVVPEVTHAQVAFPGECFGTTGTKFPLPDAELVRIDTLTGETVSAGTIAGFLSFSGLAIDSEGRLFAAHSSGGLAAGRDSFLYSIDVSTLAAEVVVPLAGGALQGISALAFDDNDVLYAVKTSTDELVTIDTTTGAIAAVLSLAPGVGVRNFAGLAFDRGTGLLWASTGGIVSPGSGDENAVYVIDLDALTVTKVGNLVPATEAGGIPDLFFDRTGDLYAVKNPPANAFPVPVGDIHTVDMNTGVGTFLGDMLHRVTGADCYNPPADEPTAIQVDVDVSPEDCPNEFNITKKGRLVVSIQGTADFDAATIDPASVTLAGVSPVHAVLEDVSRPAGDGECSCTDDGPDGIVDLKLHFDQPEILAALGAVGNGDVVELPLVGMTTEGDDVEGDDCVTIKVPGSGKFEPGVPTAYALDQNYPNPFNPTTSLSFSIPVESRVNLVIYNTMGQEISRLASGILAAGTHTVSWNGTDDQGRAVPSGTYLYRLTAGDFVQTRSMLLLK